MSKHLPNCPHLSKYDGLGDAGIIMAINEKHRKNDSYQNNESVNIIDNVLNRVEKSFSEMDDYVADVEKYVNEVNVYIQNLKDEKEKCCRDAYVEGYKQCKRDLKKKVYRSPYLAFIEYWENRS